MICWKRMWFLGLAPDRWAHAAWPSQNPNEACHIFRSMVSNGFEPTQFTFGSVLQACQDSGPDRFSLGIQIHGLVSKTQHTLDIVVCNTMISMCGSCFLNSASDAQQVFDSMEGGNSTSGFQSLQTERAVQKASCGTRRRHSQAISSSKLGIIQKHDSTRCVQNSGVTYKCEQPLYG